MTLDSSALIAILFAESGHLDLIDRILIAESARVAAPTLAEASMVAAGRRRRSAVGDVDALVQELGVTVVPFGEREWHAAVDAFLRFGRGRHAAALNFGDCLAYAAAVVANDSLLFVGDDFRLTDVAPA
jgi:ribonuclease VapC